MHASAIFQRTESGRSEIKNKMHGLTQSERLALIVIDGVSTYGDLKRKLNGLSEERFERAFSKLLQKSLVFEVLLPEENAVAEEFDSKTVDKFLLQDSLDPVTIMAIDPEEEFDLDMRAESVSPQQFQSMQAPPVTTAKSDAGAEHPPVSGELSAAKRDTKMQEKKPLKIASVDFYVPLEKVTGVTVDSRDVKGVKVDAAKPRVAESAPSSAKNSTAMFSVAPSRKVAWGPLLLIGGLIILIASLWLKFGR